MAWNPAEFRRQAEAKLRAWAIEQARRRGLQLEDPRTRAWIESLIRYRLRTRLPDLERDGIPGAIGVAEIGGRDAADFYMLSGLFEGREPYYPIDPDFTEVVLENEIAAGWQSKVELHDSLRYWPDNYYSVTGESLCFGGDFGPDCRLWLPCGNADQASWDPPVFQYSEMYTGEMALVAQMLFGMRGSVPYRYCYERSHGIYTAPNGSKWVIEISIDDEGITAWELETLAVKQPGAEIDYTPVATGETLPLLQDRVQLAPASELQDYADSDPHFVDCGWAFSADGSKAVNCTHAPSDDPGIDARLAQLWRVSISGGSSGPTSATVALVDSDWLYNDSQTLNNMKMLKREFGGCFRSFQFSLPNDPPAGPLRAPVHAFYDGNTEVVIYHRHDPFSQDIVDGKQPDAIYGCYDPIDLGLNASAEPYRKGADTILSASWFEISGGYDRGLETPDNNWSSRAIECSGNWQQLGGWVTHIHQGSPGVASNHWRLNEINVVYDFNPPPYYEQLLIPAHSRTAFYIFQAKQPHAESTKTTYTSITGYAAGTFIPYRTCGAVNIEDWIHRFGYINPCGCGDINDIVGKVVEREAPQFGIGEYELAVGVPLENPQPEPNGIYDSQCLFDVLCFEQGRTGTRYNRGACEWIDPGCVGNCSSPERRTTVVEVLEPEDQVGHCKLMYYDRGQRTALVDDAFSFDYAPYWLIQEDGSACQWMDVMRDAHSGNGSVSASIEQPFFIRHVFGGADAKYPLDELNKRMKGWFGIPFP